MIRHFKLAFDSALRAESNANLVYPHGAEVD